MKVTSGLYLNVYISIDQRLVLQHCIQFSPFELEHGSLQNSDLKGYSSDATRKKNQVVPYLAPVQPSAVLCRAIPRCCHCLIQLGQVYQIQPLVQPILEYQCTQSPLLEKQLDLYFIYLNLTVHIHLQTHCIPCFPSKFLHR